MPTTERRHGRLRRLGLAGLVLAAVVAPGRLALADAGHDPEPVEATSPPMPTPEPGREGPVRARLTLRAPTSVGLGEELRLEAVLSDGEGTPIPGAIVTVSVDSAWGDVIRGPMVLGAARTDDSGTATIVTDLRQAGDQELTASFAGGDGYRPATATWTVSVVGDRQLYEPEVGLRVPGLGIWWLFLLVAAVWGLYVLVGRQVVAIARAGAEEGSDARGAEAPAPNQGRRGFLRHLLLPLGLTAGVASIGSGLLALIARSPRTHWNAGEPESHTDARHTLTPVARLGGHEQHAELPPLLEREVSFRDEVLPILLEKGGPHTHPSAYSPPPHGVRLDSYEAIVGGGATEEEDAHAGSEEEGAHGHRLVVPGKPEESMLVMMLLDHARQMPPSVPLLEPEIQLIATWVAQGAKDN